MTDALKIAADPEMFVTDMDGKVSSAAGKLGCSKLEKKEFSGYNIQEDNVLVEFDIDPVTTADGLVSSIKNAIEGTNKFLLPLDLKTTTIASHVYTVEELSTFNSDAFVFGCTPDFNVLNGRRNPKPRAEQGLRSAGGHVHIGWDDIGTFGYNHQELQHRVGVLCDYFLGLRSVVLDSDTRRRELYGKAGSVRFKDYGIEYRTLSNYWIFSDAEIGKVFDGASLAFSFAVKNGYFEKITSEISPRDVQHAINVSDKHSCAMFLQRLNEVIGCHY